ncbi:hypothetical protein CONCODRAFT_77374 [Conidiobolus coronatus NRRL 28638]|uniref:Uncharacterized protein n=1 Tax=Conidiobolus coronatus (strain ATCC 28846 / CBS 209.66 / NRRL 28638) TaxID=796925 RepID=A0A137PEI8_CONC2|nr:hypothetical protein CONCODRAFT_77374 [Conidiobolus coronatus NRRL 28638]|eukprot:KXN73424.1 hypothetical protein CONCODRAFT_77374 [Conidiobolus coronatus NRRL 28638]
MEDNTTESINNNSTNNLEQIQDTKMDTSDLGNNNQLKDVNPEFEGESEEEEGFDQIAEQFGSDSAQQEDYYGKFL